MECERHLDIGEGMTYCRKHCYWFMFSDGCEDCEKEKITKCVENENKL